MKMDKVTLKNTLKKALEREECGELFQEYFGPNASIDNKLALFVAEEEIDFGDFSQQYVLKEPSTYLRKSDIGVDAIRAFLNDLNEYLEKKASAKSQIIQNECLEVISKKTKKAMIVLMTVMIVGALAAIVFTVMEHLLKGECWRWLQGVPEVIGVVDLAFGVIAFVVERFSDMDGKKVVAAGELYRKDPSMKNAQTLAIINVNIHNGDNFCGCCVKKEYNG